ncbi:MAG: hypothetical protein H0U86_17240, partial [Chloroflexi bacterium]|nr:hypothetical protein [Chloroflexota bacterium]
MRRDILLVAIASLALTACAGQPATSSAPAQATTPPATAAATDVAADPLEGTWTTEEMSAEELKQAALDAGHSDADVEEFFSGPLGLHADAA